MAIAAALLASGPARAQTNTPVKGFSLDRYEPSGGGSDWFSLESIDFRGNGRPSLGVIGDYAYKPLVLYNRNDEEVANIVTSQFFLHVGFSINLFDRLRLGASLPIVLSQEGDDGAITGVGTYLAPRDAGIGDLRASADIRLFGRHRGPIRAAIGGYVFFPTGNQDKYTGDGRVRVAPRAMIAGDLGPLAYAVQGGLHLRPVAERGAFPELGNEAWGGVAVGVRPADWVMIGPEAYGTSTISNSNFGKVRSSPFELLFGIHFTIADDLHLDLGAAPGLTQGLGEPRFRALARLEYFPAIKAPPDRDKDGVFDYEDACPDEPGRRTKDPDTNGCPVRPPPPPPPSDRDKDGIIDAADACPDTPGVATDDPKTNGCPADRDKDGIPDTEDACPDAPGKKTDDPKTNGCPDRDNDGILDPVDACPDAAGPPDPDPKKNGCPAARVEAGQIIITQQVKFRTGSATILPESDTILEAVKKIFDEHPEIKKVRIEGHTDNRGGSAYNMTLSKKRAAAVVKWLVDHGIEKSRLLSQGYGFTKPIATNKTEEGRQENRRVELHIVDPPQAESGAAP